MQSILKNQSKDTFSYRKFTYICRLQIIQNMEIIKKKFLIIWILFLIIPLSILSESIKNVPIVKLFDKEFYKYEITKKQSVYSVCKTFKVTEADLLSMNPFLANGLKIGQTLLIPVIATDNKKKSDQIDEEVQMTNDENLMIIPVKLPRISVLLPFAPSETPGANERYLEFYEGFLLAVDSLKSLGLSFEVQAIDVGFKPEGINHAISSGALDETDYFIGGISNEQINVLSDWVYNRHKSLVLPFSSKISAMDNNPYLFQTNTPYSYVYKRLSEYASIRFAGMNIIFVNKSGDIGNENQTLFSIMKEQFEKKGIRYTEVTEDEELVQLTQSLTDYRKNVIIPSQMTLNDASQFITRLSAVANRDTTKKISLFGYPEWQAINKRIIPRMYDLNTLIFSNFFANFQDQYVRNFQLTFNKTFGKDLLNTYPKYGMMGFDIASWFIPRMVYEKTTHPLIQGPTPLQNDFQFKTTNPGSGAFNQVFYLINYSPENIIDVKQLK